MYSNICLSKLIWELLVYRGGARGVAKGGRELSSKQPAATVQKSQSAENGAHHTNQEGDR